MTILDAIAKAGVAFVALKENIRIEGRRDIQTKVMTTLFALFAEVERDLISERTREGLARARSSGRKLGRPKGSLGVSRLDGKEDEIRRFLELGVSKTAIAKLTGVSRTALYSFMSTRGPGPGALGTSMPCPTTGGSRQRWPRRAFGAASPASGTRPGNGRVRVLAGSPADRRRIDAPGWRPFGGEPGRRPRPPATSSVVGVESRADGGACRGAAARRRHVAAWAAGYFAAFFLRSAQ